MRLERGVLCWDRPVATRPTWAKRCAENPASDREDAGTAVVVSEKECLRFATKADVLKRFLVGYFRVLTLRAALGILMNRCAKSSFASQSVDSYLLESQEHLSVTPTVSSMTNGHFVATIFSLSSNSMRDPPHGRMVKENCLSDRLNCVHQVIMRRTWANSCVITSRICSVVSPKIALAGNKIIGSSQPITVGTLT